MIGKYRHSAVCLILLFCAIFTQASTFTATLKNGTGTTLTTAYLRFELWNCGTNFPTVSGQPQTIVQFTFDLRANPTTGIITGTVLGNDVILCGNVASTEWIITPMFGQNQPFGPSHKYVICDSGIPPGQSFCSNSVFGTAAFASLNPTDGVAPPSPGFNPVYSNPAASQTLTEPLGSQFNFVGTVNMCSANVLCGSGLFPVAGTPNQILITPVGSPAINTLSLASPLLLPGAVVSNGPVGASNVSNGIYTFTDPYCAFQGASSAQDLIICDLQGIGPVFNNGNGTASLSYQLNKIQISGYLAGQVNCWNATNGDFEPGNCIPQSLDGIAYADQFPGVDIGAQVNNAIVSLPGFGGTVVLPVGAFNFSTAITMNRPNVILLGAGSALNAGGGTSLIWTGGASAAIVNSDYGTILRGFNLNNTGTGTVGISIVGAGVNYRVLLDDISIYNPTTPFSVAGVQTNGTQMAWFTMRHCWIQAAAPIGADIDKTNLFVSDNSTFANNNTNIRVGHTGQAFSFNFLNGSDSELLSTNGTGGIGLDIQSAVTVNLKDSWFEANQDGAAGQEGQLQVKVSSVASYIDIDGNYFTGNSHTNYGAKLAGTGAVVTFRNNTFNNFITAGIDNTTGTTTLIQVQQNSQPGITPLIISGTSGIDFNLDTNGNLSLGAHLNQVVTKTFAGSCAMSAGTTCTFTLVAAFTGTPLTFASIDAASTVPATANSAKCAISGTTVTITAGISNSLTWDCLLIGNPN
jgi:hypothetical protein